MNQETEIRSAILDERLLQIAIPHNQVSALVDDRRHVAVLLLALPGARDAKGTIVRMLLSHTPGTKDKACSVGDTPLALLEADMIQYTLGEMGARHALALLMGLVKHRLNNTRFRKTILRYVFEREGEVVRRMVLRHRRKILRLVRHCMSRHLMRRMAVGTAKPRWARIQYEQKREVIAFLLGHGQISSPLLTAYLAAKSNLGALEGMEKAGFPRAVVPGFYRSRKEEVPPVWRTSIRALRLNLYRAYVRAMRQVERGDRDGWDRLTAEIERQSSYKYDLRMGGLGVVIDCGARPSIRGFLTSMVVASLLDGVKAVGYGGVTLKDGFGEGEKIAFPGPRSDIPSALLEIQSRPIHTVIFLSDGQDLDRKRMIDAWTTYSSPSPMRALHVQPVSSPEEWVPRPILEGLDPILLLDAEYFRTAIILRRINEQPQRMEEILMAEYRKAIGKMRGAETEFLLT